MDDKQKEALEKPLNKAHVKQRKQGGRPVSYIEGWHAIQEANEIFSFDGWDRETIYNKQISSVGTKVGKENPRDGFKVGYEAKVRIKVGDIIREGTGYGSGISVDLFDAIESAGKEAETDAMKRAFMTFGNRFGLALYDKQQKNVHTPTHDELCDPEGEYFDAKVASNHTNKRLLSFTEIGGLIAYWQQDKVKKRIAKIYEQSSKAANFLAETFEKQKEALNG